MTVVTLYLWPHCPFSALDLAYHVMPTHCMSSYTCAINLPIWIHSSNAKACVVCQIATIWMCHNATMYCLKQQIGQATSQHGMLAWLADKIKCWLYWKIMIKKKLNLKWSGSDFDETRTSGAAGPKTKSGDPLSAHPVRTAGQNGHFWNFKKSVFWPNFFISNRTDVVAMGFW